MLCNVLSITLCIGAIVTSVFCTGELNDGCSLVQDCRNFGYYCSGNRTCQCLPGEYIPNKYRDKCVGFINRKCKYDEHCIEGAYCKEQKMCSCKEGLSANEDNTECSNSSRPARSAETMIFSVLLVLSMYLFKIL